MGFDPAICPLLTRAREKIIKVRNGRELLCGSSAGDVERIIRSD